MICTNCATDNAPGRKFCANCGAHLAAVCSNCGAANSPGDRFCGECGTALTPDAPTAASVARPSEAVPASRQPEAPVAERRLVSILFADLVGFTTYSESRDAEEVREILGSYFELARDVIARYGGTVEKFIGDAVMAVWGAPVAREDDAERSVRAALELVDAVRGMTAADAAEAERLHVRAGVLTGEAAVTLGAVGQGMVAGDLVNTASRLQSLAPPDSVLVGDSTRRATKDAIAYESVGEQQVKGKALPVPAWRAVQVLGMLGGGGRTERLEAPFVGRDPELRLLKDMLHATARERRLRVVSVTGIAGIGKSRLAWEFLKYIDGLVEQFYWHQGRSPAYGEGVTFWALGEMVRRRAGIAELDDEATSRAKLAAALTEFVPDDADRRWIGPRLEALLGLGEAPPGEREETFAAWRAFFERVAAVSPAVLVFEELHWADAGVLDFIESMLEWSRNHPILIVTLGRPELLERRPTWGAGQRNFVALHLEPLDDAAMRQLLAGLAPGLPDDVVGRILGRAEGVPLYAVETVRMLVDEGALVEADGRFRVASDISRLAIPETLQALIAARIDGLDSAERAVLQDAAILGHSFTRAALAALSGQVEGDLDEVLRSLVHKEVLVLDADPRSPERGQYGFVQSLIREVAHETISKRDRRAKHLAAARYFEALGEEELAGVLANHYVQAYEATPAGPEAEALAAQARVALRAAADRATALYSHDQALAFLEQAESVTKDPSERAGLWERLADAARAAGRPQIAEERLEQAIAWYRAQDDAVAVARSTARLGEALLPQGRVEPAIARLREVPRDGLPAKESARIGALLGRAYMLRGEWQQASAELEQALAAAGPIQDPETIAEALTSKGPVLDELQRVDEGIAVLHGAIALSESHGLVNTRLRASYNLAGRLYLDDPAAAFRVLREGLELARRLGQRGWFMGLAGFAVGAATDAGEWDWAVELAAEAREGQPALTDRVELESWLAPILAYRGRIEEADGILSALEPVVAQSTNRGNLQTYWWSRAFVAEAAGRNEEGYAASVTSAGVIPEDYGIAMTTAASIAIVMGDQARVRQAFQSFDLPRPGRLVAALRDQYRAAVAAFDGRTAEATRAYLDVVRKLRDLGVPQTAATAILELAALVGVRDPQVAAAVEEIRTFWRKIGADALIARLDEVIARGPVADLQPSRMGTSRPATETVPAAPRP